MQPSSRRQAILCLAGLALLGLLCGVLFHFTASRSPLAVARDIPHTRVDGEVTEPKQARNPQNAETPVDVENVYQVSMAVQMFDPDENQEKKRRYLIRMGEKAFPAYEAILTDPKSPYDSVCGVLCILRYVKADRRCFIKYALARLTDEDFTVRHLALELLGKIGSSTEMPPVVALLSDEQEDIANCAARTLAALGGPNELVAMDVWLNGTSHRANPHLRSYVRECRDKLKKRLDEQSKDPTKDPSK
jgi:HEAT repeats